MMDRLFGAMREKASSWEKDAKQRRTVSQIDPVADTLDFVASELLAEVERLQHDLRYLTPEEYAELKGDGVSAQSVRNWIKAGELEAHRGPKGWQIPVTAVRKRKRAA